MVRESDVVVLGELRRASAMVGVSRRGTAQPGQRAKVRSMAISPGQSCVGIDAEFCCRTSPPLTLTSSPVIPGSSCRGTHPTDI